MNHILPILFLSMFINSFALKTTYLDGSECNCDSIITDHYSNGKIHKEIPFLNKQRHGKLIVYNQEGKIIADYTFKSGILDGVFHKYDESGSIQYYGSFAQDSLENGLVNYCVGDGQYCNEYMSKFDGTVCTSYKRHSRHNDSTWEEWYKGTPQDDYTKCSDHFILLPQETCGLDEFFKDSICNPIPNHAKKNDYKSWVCEHGFFPKNNKCLEQESTKFICLGKSLLARKGKKDTQENIQFNVIQYKGTDTIDIELQGIGLYSSPYISRIILVKDASHPNLWNNSDFQSVKFDGHHLTMQGVKSLCENVD